MLNNLIVMPHRKCIFAFLLPTFHFQSTVHKVFFICALILTSQQKNQKYRDGARHNPHPSKQCFNWSETQTIFSKPKIL